MKIIIFGIGGSTVKHLNLITELKDMDIIALTDNDPLKQNKVIEIDKKAYRTIEPNQILNNEFDYVIVISIYYDIIRKQLIELGVNEKQVKKIDAFLLMLKIDIERLRGSKGIEIGGPSVVFSDIYEVAKQTDGVNFSINNLWFTTEEENNYIFDGKYLGSIYIKEGTNLIDIENESYDFVLSSNNLEHIANPILALEEWKRVLKKEGMLIIVVPAKKWCFDHKREFTLFEHLLKDYNFNVQESDLTHLQEILEMHDYEMDNGTKTKQEFMERSLDNVNNRAIHHHVFSLDVLMKCFEFLEFEVIHSSEVYTNYLIVGKK